MAYRTQRKKIAEALTEKIKEIDGNHPFNSNIFQNADSHLVFLDEIQQYPKVCVVAAMKYDSTNLEVLNGDY